jgi:hypothetical protein
MLLKSVNLPRKNYSNFRHKKPVAVVVAVAKQQTRPAVVVAAVEKQTRPAAAPAVKFTYRI